jgi:hypothetical protein
VPVTTEKFVAQVMANNDDELRGRIQVTCADLTGDPEAVLPIWIEPVFEWGMFLVPDVDEFVEIEIVTSTDDDESFGQSMIYEPRIHWRAKRFYHEGGDTETPIHADFKTNYGKRRGFATPAGHILLFDDTDGSEFVSLSCKDGNVLILDSAGIRLGEAATKGIARLDDLVVAGTSMSTWITAVGTALNALGQPVTPPSDFGQISTASSKMKAE